jgi:hypothetical protein
MSEANICSKLKELADKANEVGDKLLTFYGWQWDVLPDVYASIALLVLKNDKLSDALKEEFAVVHRALAKLLHHVYETRLECSYITEVPRLSLIDLKCDINGKLGVEIDKAIEELSTEIDNLEEAAKMCDYHLEEAVEEARIILRKLDKIFATPIILDSKTLNIIKDVYNWISLAYADAEYLTKATYEAYKMVKEGLEAVKNELEKLIKPVKEERKEGEKQ